MFTRFLTALLLGCALLGGAADAEQIDVMNSGGFTAAYKALQPKFERELFDKLGIAEQVKPKPRMIGKTPVAALVASGDPATRSAPADSIPSNRTVSRTT